MSESPRMIDLPCNRRLVSEREEQEYLRKVEDAQRTLKALREPPTEPEEVMRKLRLVTIRPG